MDIPVNRSVLGWYGHGYTIKQNQMYGHGYTGTDLVLDGMVMDIPLSRTGSMVMNIPVDRPGLGWYGHGYTIKQNHKYGHGYTSTQTWSWMVWSWIHH